MSFIELVRMPSKTTSLSGLFVREWSLWIRNFLVVFLRLAVQRATDAFRILTLHVVLLALYLLVIAGVAAYDCYLTVELAPVLNQTELNPIGRWLMGLDAPGKAITRVYTPNIIPFLTLKMTGTFVVLSVIAWLYCRRRPVCHAVGGGVASFQAFLGMFLTYA